MPHSGVRGLPFECEWRLRYAVRLPHRTARPNTQGASRHAVDGVADIPVRHNLQKLATSPSACPHHAWFPGVSAFSLVLE